MKRIGYILLIIICLFVFVGCENKTPIDDDDNNIVADYELDKPFQFMNFEITIKSSVKILTIKKELSADNNKQVIQVPVSVRNTGNDNNHISMFYYKFYNYSGIQLSSKGSYYNDSLDYAKDLAPGEKYDKFFYIPYDGDGKYIIEFNNFSKKYKVILKVTK